MAQRMTGVFIRTLHLFGKTSIFSETSHFYGVAPDESTETGRQQRENFTKPKWKNYDFTMFWSRIITSRYIAVKWYLRVYWLLPLSIVDSFAEHRRFFCWAPWILGPVQSTSFPKGVFSLFQRTLFLFINWNCRQLGRSHTESTDTSHKTLLSFCLTKRSCQRYRTQVFCWAVQRYVLALLKDRYQWNGAFPLAYTLEEGKRKRYKPYLCPTKNLLIQIIMCPHHPVSFSIPANWYSSTS